jgi:mannan endo-1,4-beta-mannosidase
VTLALVGACGTASTATPSPARTTTEAAGGAPGAAGTTTGGAGGAPGAARTTTEAAGGAPGAASTTTGAAGGAPGAASATTDPASRGTGRPGLAGPSAAASRDAVTRRGSILLLDGRRWTFDGVDDYTLTSDRGHDVGCGAAPTTSQIDALFAALPPGSVVRTWAFQDSAGLNPKTGQRDWTGLDRVVDAAASRGVKLILSLASQDGACDGGTWKGPLWYAQGYHQALDSGASSEVAGSPRAHPVAYNEWVSEVVTRYRHDPTVAMYEPVNEPEASTCAAAFSGASCYGHTSCPSEARAAGLLRRFFDAIGAEIHRIDPASLVEEGTIGSGQCGTSDTDYAKVAASPGLDVLSVHDYSAPTAVLSGDRYNGQRLRLAQAARVGKPIIAGEIGIDGAPAPVGSSTPSAGSACLDLKQRASDLERKVDADLAAGYAGGLVWDYQPRPASRTCSYDLGPGDPYLSWLARR